jgi:hypothetical protein
VEADDVNRPLFALTANVYAVPFVSPGTTQDVAGALTVQVAPFGDAVTVYEAIAGPPVMVGAVNETVAEPLPGTAFTPVGASGFPAGVTEDEADVALEVPVELVAVALKVYAVPFVNGEIEHDVAGALTVHVAPPGDAVTTYEAGAPPPAFAARVIVAPPSDPVTDEIVGTRGIAIFHCAITVEFVKPIVVANPAARTAVPSLHPSKVKPGRLNPVAPSSVMFAPCTAAVAAGVAPAVAPLVL